MLDRDLAELYGVMTGELNQAVKRHANRFPEDFLFKLTAEEAFRLRSQIVTAKTDRLISQSVISKKGRGGQRFLSNVFTEQGVAMLSSVLASERAVEINIAIMRAFVKLRQAVMIDGSLAVRMEKAEEAIESLEGEQGEQAVAIHELMAAFRRLTGS
ncbi:MAG: ORF6N domain-containing protein [Elusimicrobia bacterium]|nr:ORF6N domain-containing protein [Elusimicrobiota bacterium]